MPLLPDRLLGAMVCCTRKLLHPKQLDSTPESLFRRIRVSNNQVLADVAIWEHQRYTHPPGLATTEARGFRNVRRWARRFYAPGDLGSGAAEQDAGREAAELLD